MSKINLTNGQDVVLLDLGTDQFIKPGNFTPGSSFTYHTVTVSPTVSLVESDGNNEVELDDANYIQDNFGNQYPKIVGKRPKVRPRA